LNGTTTDFQDQRVLVTGAGGFMGLHLIETLRRSGARISTLSRSPIKVAEYTAQHLGDIRNREFVSAAVQESRPAFIFHLCAYKNRLSDLNQFSVAIDTNLTGSLNLISAASGLPDLRAIVTVGTAEEYGNNPAPFLETMREEPVSAYSFSKLCVTQLAQLLSRAHGIPITVLRPTLAYGPGQKEDMFLPALIGTLLRGETFDMSAGEQTRDFIYIDDVVDAMIKAASRPESFGQVINIGSGNPVAMSELALRVQQLLGKSGLVRAGALNYRNGEVMEYFVRAEKAHRTLGWAPKVPLELGLARTIAHYRERH